MYFSIFRAELFEKNNKQKKQSVQIFSLIWAANQDSIQVKILYCSTNFKEFFHKWFSTYNLAFKKVNVMYYNIPFSILVNVPQNQDQPLGLYMAHVFQVLNVLLIVEQLMEIVLQALVFVVFISKSYFDYDNNCFIQIFFSDFLHVLHL